MAADRPTNEEIIALSKQEPFKTIFKKRLRETLDAAVKNAEKHAVAGEINEAVGDILAAGLIEAIQEKLG